MPKPDDEARRLRVLMVGFFYPPDTGGLPAQTHLLARSLLARGLHVEVATAGSSWGQPSESTLDGVRVHRLPTLPHGGYRTRAHPWLVPLAGYLALHRHRFDLLHVHQALHPAALCVAMAKLLRWPVLVKVTGSGACGNVRILRQWKGSAPLVRALLHRADRMISLSQDITRELLDDGYQAARIAEFPNGVDLARFTGARLPIDPARPIVVTSTRLAIEKGNDVLLHAWRGVVARLAGARLVILGEGPQLEALRSLAASLGLSDSVELPGHVVDVVPPLTQAALFVLPSRYGEGMSNALLEALAAGCACLASDIPTNRQVLREGAVGALFRSEDVGHLAERMLGLLTDVPQLQALGHAARAEAVAHYSIDGVARHYQKLYAQLLDRTD